MQTPLINIQDVRDFTGLSERVEETKYNQFIISAQSIQLKEIIGKECLEDLENAYCNNNMDQYQTELYSIVKPYLVNYSYSKYVYSSPLTSTEEGIVKFTGDNILHLTETEKKRERQFYANNAESYKDQMIELLESDIDNYACFHNSGKCSCCGKEDLGRSIFDL